MFLLWSLEAHDLYLLWATRISRDMLVGLRFRVGVYGVRRMVSSVWTSADHNVWLTSHEVANPTIIWAHSYILALVLL